MNPLVDMGAVLYGNVNLSAGALRTLLGIQLWEMHGFGGVVGESTLCKLLDLSKATFHEHIQELEAAGLVSVDKTKRFSG